MLILSVWYCMGYVISRVYRRTIGSQALSGSRDRGRVETEREHHNSRILWRRRDFCIPALTLRDVDTATRPPLWHPSLDPVIVMVL